MSSTFPQSGFQPVPPDPHWKGILECSAVEVFSIMLGVELAAFPGSFEDRHGEQTAIVGLAGALCGMVAIRCSSATAEKIATVMLAADPGSKPSMMGDALGELCNMVAGNFKSKVSTIADHCMLSMPTVIWGEHYVMQTFQSQEAFEVVLSFEGEPVWFSIVIQT